MDGALPIHLEISHIINMNLPKYVKNVPSSYLIDRFDCNMCK